jgi:hypothetical protein
MLEHRTMRIDGPAFRGRPLGHRFDPLRCELAPLDADQFEQVVGDLLTAYDFRAEQSLDPGSLLDNVERDGHRAILSVGTLHSTFEWMFQLGTQFGYAYLDEPRTEGQAFRAFGRVAVVIHSHVEDSIHLASSVSAGLSDLAARGVTQLVVFGNAPDDRVMAPYLKLNREFKSVVGEAEPGPPIGLGSLAFNLLTTTLVYLDHRGSLRWRYINYLAR